MSSKSKWSMLAKRKDDAFVGLGPRPQTKLQPIKEEPLPVTMIVMIREEQLEPGSRLYSMGQCSIIVSPPVDVGWGWHLSIAHPTRYPTWDEVAKARYELLPLDVDFDMPLPRPENYVSIHSNCFHVWESGKQRSVR
jgi:hypothetical protein